MILAVHLSIVRIFLLQNDTHRTVGQLQLGKTLAVILKRTDISYHITDTCNTVCSLMQTSECHNSLFFSIHLGLCQLILQNEA